MLLNMHILRVVVGIFEMDIELAGCFLISTSQVCGGIGCFFFHGKWYDTKIDINRAWKSISLFVSEMDNTFHGFIKHILNVNEVYNSSII